jgi:hypothetical protein
MAPWEKYGGEQPKPPQPAGPWAKYAEPEKRVPFDVLPFSTNEKGEEFRFDSDAGILGAAKRAVTLPGDVVSGKVDPLDPAIRDRTLDLATIISPAAAPLRAGEFARMAGIKRSRVEPKAPTTQALEEAGAASMDRAGEMGVEYAAPAIKSMAEGIQTALESKGIIEKLSPKTFAIIGELRNPPPDSIGTVRGLVAARRALQEAAGDFQNPTEQKAASAAIEELDRFILGGAPEGSVVGPATAAGRALEEGRGNFAAAFRSDRLAGAEYRADLRSAAANSGANLDNAIRQRFADILLKPKDARGYSAEELAAIERVAKGSLGRNAARRTGNLLGGGGGLGQMFSSAVGAAGGSAVDPVLGVVGALGLPSIGHGSRMLANSLARHSVEGVDEMVRKRSPLYQKMQAEAPFDVNSPETRAALVRALMLYDAQRQ